MHKDITHPLKQVGPENGDKAYLGDIPNLKKGEYRYYPGDNPNIKQASTHEIRREEFITLLANEFPTYIVSPLQRNSNNEDPEYWIGSIGEIEEVQEKLNFFHLLSIKDISASMRLLQSRMEPYIIYTMGLYMSIEKYISKLE
jgi:hypothetical protein